MAASNIMAGSDTTAISMRAVIYHLLRNPEYKRSF
jgi:cytochrome P450